MIRLFSFKTVLGAATMAVGLMATLDVAAAAGQAPSQPSTTTATYGDWVLRCVAAPAPAEAAPGAATAPDAAVPATESCEVVLTVQIQGQAQPIAQLAFGRLPGATELIMTAVLPVNIALPGRIHISGNARSGAEEQGGVDMAWRRCVPGACFADARPDEAALAVFRAETAGQLQFEDAAGRAITLPLSWRGLTQALAALK